MIWNLKKEGHMGATTDLYRWAAAAAPELGPIGLVVEDHGRSGQGRNNILFIKLVDVLFTYPYALIRR